MRNQPVLDISQYWNPWIPMKNQPVFDISHFETYELQCKSMNFLRFLMLNPMNSNENAMVVLEFLRLSLINSNAKSMVFLKFLKLGLMNSIVKAMFFGNFSSWVSWAPMSHEFHSKTNGFERVSQVESHEFQCKTNGLCKVFHTESHEFHSKTNGIAQILYLEPDEFHCNTNYLKGFHYLMISHDHGCPLLGGSAKKSAFSNSAYLVDLLGGGEGGGGLLIRGWHYIEYLITKARTTGCSQPVPFLVQVVFYAAVFRAFDMAKSRLTEALESMQKGQLVLLGKTETCFGGNCWFLGYSGILMDFNSWCWFK